MTGTPPASPLRIAVIGCGGIANREHYAALASFPEVEIVGACDLDPRCLHDTADRWGIEGRYSNYRAMIEAEAPDAVYVVLRPHHLYDPAAWCLQQGLHLFMEKPPGITAYQTRSLAQIAERNECLTMVALNRRYSPLLNAARDLVLSRGPMTSVVCGGYVAHGDKPGYYDGAVNILHCHGVHYLDTLRWLAGDVKQIASQVRSSERDFETGWFALTRHEGGCSGTVMLNWQAGGGRPYDFEMHGRGISVFVGLTGRWRVLVEGEEDPEALAQFTSAPQDNRLSHYGFREENRHFIDCLLEGRQPLTNLADATKSMELADLLLAAARPARSVGRIEGEI